eukprot:gene4407-6678_t
MFVSTSIVVSAVLVLLLARQLRRADFVTGSVEFRSFQWRFLTVYLIMTAADWIQGPYVYKLYEHYGFTIEQNGQLFIAGFGASLVLGTVAGSMADKFGRKFGAVLYGFIYMASCLTKHVNSFYILLLGRVLGGIATSLLFSVFEAWMVAEHTTAGFDSKWIASTFGIMAIGNGIVAIASGWVAQASVDVVGHPVATFDMSFLLLAIGTASVLSTWSENYGASNQKFRQNIQQAAEVIWNDRTVLLLGSIQALFEGAMYTFVFVWTPALQENTEHKGILLPLGLIFSTFMMSSAVGGAIFQELTSVPYNISVSWLLRSSFLVSGIVLLVPILTTNLLSRFLCFLIYESAIGIFWPSIATLRANYVPETVRATILNLFRVPLNGLVCLLLMYIGNLSIASVFTIIVAAQGKLDHDQANKAPLFFLTNDECWKPHIQSPKLIGRTLQS